MRLSWNRACTAIGSYSFSASCDRRFRSVSRCRRSDILRSRTPPPAMYSDSIAWTGVPTSPIASLGRGIARMGGGTDWSFFRVSFRRLDRRNSGGIRSSGGFASIVQLHDHVTDRRLDLRVGHVLDRRARLIGERAEDVLQNPHSLRGAGRRGPVVFDETANRLFDAADLADEENRDVTLSRELGFLLRRRQFVDQLATDLLLARRHPSSSRRRRTLAGTPSTTRVRAA